jgi:adenine-specific DNA-methyltransferase
MASSPKKTATKVVEAITHTEVVRKNIPTAEYEPVVAEDVTSPIRVAISRRNCDLDPQLVWRGKELQDAADLVVQAPPLYIQEKVHPKALIDDLLRQSREREHADGDRMADLFADFNGIPHGADKTEFYQHDQNWTNRMILGDSLQVMASLAEREGLRGKVQCIYFDPPYGIKFNSNFQWSTTSRDVKDGKADHITREPEQVKAFRDTWRDGIHSYLTYLRDRLAVARDLLTDSGSIFVQIGDENVHRVRALMDEVFGEENICALLVVRKTSSLNSPAARVNVIPGSADFVIWYAKRRDTVKYRQLYNEKTLSGDGGDHYRLVELADGTIRPIAAKELVHPETLPPNSKVVRADNLISQGYSEPLSQPFAFQGRSFNPGATSHWKTTMAGLGKLSKSGRLLLTGKTLAYKRCFGDFPVMMVNSIWEDIGADPAKTYVVQTPTAAIRRCIVMTTDPGDLVLDPTCGSGTTATVAEQWGRRWITIDTSRVALALARARIMGARYPFYLLTDSREGQFKEAEVTRTAPSSQPVQGNVRHGFVYERVPHITLKSIANNTEIDVIWEQWQAQLEPLRDKLNAALKTTWQEWEIPREAESKWPEAARKLHADWWQARIARQQEIDKSIAAKAEFEYLYDRPYEDKKKVRVAGPFTVESVSPVRTLGVGTDDELIDPADALARGSDDRASFTQMVLENLRTAGVQQAHKADKIDFSSVVGWPGQLICGEGRYLEGEHDSGTERRAAIFVGPEFGTVNRADLVAAAREAADAGFDVLVACAFAYQAHTTEFSNLGKLPVLKARMNADLHMANDLKNTGKGNLFVIFGEPDIEMTKLADGRYTVRVRGVDVFNPATGKVKSDGPEGIACWFLDTDYNEESFLVRHAYFLGANDPYSSLKTTLKAEIDREAWESLNSDVSRPFDRPNSCRIAVKVINHLGDEVMKVFKVE